jgi:short-subunit dehydrogenase
MAAETVLITGASSGIGLELAKVFAAGKSRLVLTARSKDRLEQLAGEIRQQYEIEVRVLCADLADPKAPAAIFAELKAAGIQVDVLVNNAGFGAAGPFAELPLQQQLEMVQVNLAALTHLTGLFLPAMIARGCGGVLNVSSTAAFQPGPLMAVYYATKSYVLSFTEALAEELSGTGVRATCLAPGPTATGFAAAARIEDTLLLSLGTMDSRTVALAGYRGFRAGRAIVVPGWKNRLGAIGARFVPPVLLRKLVKRLNQKRA